MKAFHWTSMIEASKLEVQNLNFQLESKKKKRILNAI